MCSTRFEFEFVFSGNCRLCPMQASRRSSSGFAFAGVSGNIRPTWGREGKSQTCTKQGLDEALCIKLGLGRRCPVTDGKTAYWPGATA